MSIRLPVHEHSCASLFMCVGTYVCTYWSHVRILYSGRRAWTPPPPPPPRAWVRIRILDSYANVKGRILQLNISIPLKCGTGCLFTKLKLGRVGMGRVLHLEPSWHGPSFMWAELAWAEFVLGRVVLHPIG